ncbi:SRPBCC family protein [Halorientalis halophila]|uniref:SRPBCC family protein n=1 Tax=Halorientalis halophila TaxID=3108499 RepID=UPI00300BD589
MDSVSVTRTFDAPPDQIREAMADVERFMEGAGFDAVDVDGDAMRIENGFSIAAIELSLRLVDREGAELAYEQVDGIFDEMWTTYEVTAQNGGTRVTATTEFSLDVAVIGSLLDATVIKRQRRRELDAQFDWLETETGE